MHLLHVAKAASVRASDVLRRVVVLAGASDGILRVLPGVLSVALRAVVVPRLPVLQTVAAHLLPRLWLVLRAVPTNVAVD